MVHTFAILQAGFMPPAGWASQASRGGLTQDSDFEILQSFAVSAVDADRGFRRTTDTSQDRVRT
jgi:hypothetical protein